MSDSDSIFCIVYDDPDGVLTVIIDKRCNISDLNVSKMSHYFRDIDVPFLKHWKCNKLVDEIHAGFEKDNWQRFR